MPGGELLEDKYFQLFFKKADYVLLGEAHTNMTDHMSQAAILKKMAKRRLKPVIGMEFVEVDSQHILDRFNRGEISVNQLEESLSWQRSVGYSFELYRPIFEVAAAYKIPVYALNIPRRVVREARLNGMEKLPDKDKKYLPGNYIPVSDEQRERLAKFFKLHIPGAMTPDALMFMAGQGGSQPPVNMPRPGQAKPDAPAKLEEHDKAVEGFLTAQAIWDSVMAERAMRVHQTSKRPVVIIVGQGHVEYGWGVARRIAAYDEEAAIISVMPWRVPLESVFMQKQRSPLLDAALPPVFPPPDLADIYYYSPEMPIGMAPQGIVTGQNPNSKQAQLMVLTVYPESEAEKAGFLPGDIILSIERRQVAGSEDFYSALAQMAAYGNNPVITVLRGTEKINLTMPSWLATRRQ